MENIDVLIPFNVGKLLSEIAYANGAIKNYLNQNYLLRTGSVFQWTDFVTVNKKGYSMTKKFDS